MMPPLRNTWILGATGFIGTALVNSFQTTRDQRINILQHRKPTPPTWEWVNAIPGDLGHFDYTWLERFPPTKLFHLARLAGPNRLLRAAASRRGSRANNNLRSWLAEHHPSCVMTYVSGSLMYGDHADEFVTEETPLRPIAFAREYHRAELPWMQPETALDVRIARPGWIIGPGSWFREFYWKPFLADGHVPLYGSGKQWMSLIHLDDCATLIRSLGERGKPKQTLNIVAAEAIRHEEFVQMLAVHLNAPIRQVSEEAIRRNYGRAEAEALSSSCRLSSIHEGHLSSIPLRHPSVQEMVIAVTASLDKKGN